MEKLQTKKIIQYNFSELKKLTLQIRLNSFISLNEWKQYHPTQNVGLWKMSNFKKIEGNLPIPKSDLGKSQLP